MDAFPTRSLTLAPHLKVAASSLTATPFLAAFVAGADDLPGATIAGGPGFDTLTLTGGGTFDLNDMSDQAQTLAVVALFANSPTRIENVWNLRIKETDRLSALANELRRLGATVDEGHDYLVVEPLAPADARPAEVRTYGDHRMAMAFALAGLRLPGVVILEPACVTKTFPAFFDVLAAL